MLFSHTYIATSEVCGGQDVGCKTTVKALAAFECNCLQKSNAKDFLQNL